MKYLLLAVLCIGLSLPGFAQKIYTPSTNNSISATATYCQNATPSALTYVYNTCNTGSGTSSGTSLTIKWYSNTVNSNVGGTLESTTFVSSSLTATGNTTFLPSTVSVGTTYYYCEITWSGAGTCNASGILTSAVTSVVVNTAPDVITGTTTACAGTLTTLSNAVPGGTWTSATAARATISAGGVVSAVSAGTSVISYSIGTCRATTTFTVNANPVAITGTNTVCEGAVVTFTDATVGGTWSTSDPSVASINASSPVAITGVLAGTATISYTLGTGCFATRGITVNTAPAAITGTFAACVGTQTTLSNAVPGGTWTSATVARATISVDGVVSAVSAGTSVISYSIGTCRATRVFTVNANPVAITGTNTVCEGAVVTFTDATAGGTWSTSDPSVASINASSPVSVSGVLAGAATISYTLGTGCFATRGITVNTAPAAITGTFSACAGTQTTLSNAVPGGTWTSATVARATISADGVVSAVSAGTSVISYSIGTCRATRVFTVNANPAAITGTNTVCEGAVVTFTDATAGGTWSTTDPSVATINASSPVAITGVTAGAATISYTLGTGCYATRGITVNTAPAAIAGTFVACVGVQTTLTNSVGGGVWSSSAPTKATITSDGVVTAIASGTSTISYSIGACRATRVFTVNANPAAITGTNTVCEGSVVTFTNATAGGTWSTTDPSVASINASSPVAITGVLAGTATISYTLGTGCFATRGITVNTAPAAITGSSSSCVGVQTTLSNAVGGGTWTSGTVARATISAAGVVSAVSAGTTIISYSIGTCRSTLSFVVNPTPVAITGTNTVCEGSVVTFTNATAGGTWSTNDPSIATINASSPVAITGLTAGSTTISYTIGGCFATRGLTVNTAPAAIVGVTSACPASTVTLTNAVGGGTWSTGAATVATITSGGVVTAIAAGNANISYSIGTCRSVIVFTVNPNPAAITGTNTVCEGSVTTFTDATAGGTWSVNDPAIASINASSPVGITGVLSGSTTITYTLATGCRATRALTVNNTPDPIVGTTTACVGTTTTLSNATPSGVWSSSNTSIVTISSSTGAARGVAGGSATISYTTGTCRATASFVTIAAPSVISGASSVCEGSSITFSNTAAGGTWTTTDAAVATVNATTGVVTGVAAGTCNISYSTGCGSPVGKSITVNPLPAAITGTNTVCEGLVTTFSTVTAGGTWSSSAPAVATIDASSPVNITGVLAGTSTISYTLGTGCFVTRDVTVNVSPAPIAGVSAMCTGVPETLTNTVAGGTWSSSDEALATIDAGSGVVSAITTGSLTITYTIGSCLSTHALTINTLPPAPAAISGTPSTFCTGTIVTLSDATPGGAWSSTAPAVATVDAAGVVIGVSGGDATISYSFTNTCGTTAATFDVTVVDYPTASITSATNACLNYATDVVFSGTSGATITYKIDGGSDLTQTLTGGTFTLNTGIVTSSHTYRLIEVHNATCATSNDTTVTITPIPMQWVGGDFAHETEWERGGNWSCGFVPGDSTDVTIPAGTTYSPVISATRVVFARNLTIASGATVTANADGYLYVKKSLTNNGTFNGDGFLGLNDTVAQTISGKGFVSNFQLANTRGATINTGARVTITKSVVISQGTLTTNDSLVLNSDSLYSARIAEIPFGGVISGNVQVKQFIPGGYRRYRFWSHPFSTAISLGQVQKYVDITGLNGAVNGFTTTGSNNASAFRYNPLVGNSALGSDPGWKPFTNISATAADSNKLNRYQGIRIFFRGRKGQGLGYIDEVPLSTTITMTGAVNQGTQSVTLSKGSSANQDYNMVGNPFASPVDLGTVAYNAKTSGDIVGTAFYVWNPYLGTGGQYATITIGSGAPIPYFIQANTCFQIRAANNGSVMTFLETHKATSASTPLLKAAPQSVSLHIYDANYHPWDMLDVKFDDAATANEDNEFDAEKLSGGDLNFYAISADKRKLAIDARPFSTEQLIPLGLNTSYKQDYIIKAESVVVPGGNTIYLHDKLLNKFVSLEQGSEYRFSVNDQASSQGDNRFELTMKPAEATVAATSGVKVSLTPNPATSDVNIFYTSDKMENVAVRVMDVSGVNVYSRNLGNMQNGTINIPLADLAAGIYMVEVMSGNNKSVHRLIKE